MPPPEPSGCDIIAIGASAGGVHALREVIVALPADLPAAVLVVLHLAPYGRSALPAILSRSGSLPAVHPEDGEAIRPGRIYIAPPDRHMAVEDSKVRLSRNASENGHRPAIDVLFRTAARSYKRRVAGVVLTGNLDDGTSGLAAIKRCGGVAVVQDPEEADYPSMPQSAIANVEVDHVLPLAGIGPLLERLAREPRPAAPADCGGEIEKEPDTMGVSRPEGEGEGGLRGEPTGLSCPDCGGVLYEKPGEQPTHFRCRTGHAYAPESLLAKQSGTLEAALWAALRALEENAALARRMLRRSSLLGDRGSERYQRRASDAEKHAKVLREILQEGGAEMEGTG
jgi:two-component system chemotaxis response regulator CheB